MNGSHLSSNVWRARPLEKRKHWHCCRASFTPEKRSLLVVGHEMLPPKRSGTKKKRQPAKRKTGRSETTTVSDQKSNPTTTNKKNGLITSYFPVVSRRILAAKLKEVEHDEKIRHHIGTKTDPKDFLAITDVDGKGRAIIATESIRKGSFICEYSGDLIDLKTAKDRESQYELSGAGCYMYYFQWNSSVWCVDATKPTHRYGRLINHSRKAPNCKTKIYEYENEPHLIFVALRDIVPNEEILYDYGERDPNAIKWNPWLTSS